MEGEGEGEAVEGVLVQAKLPTQANVTGGGIGPEPEFQLRRHARQANAQGSEAEGGLLLG